MKKSENVQLHNQMEVLTMEETTEIVGGESLVFWIGYAIGRIFS